MKSSKFGLEDDKKQTRSAASHFPSNSMINPPAFSLQAGNLQNAHSDLSSTAVDPGNDSQEIENQDEDESQQHIANVSPNHISNAFSDALGFFENTSRLSGTKVQGARAFGGNLDGIGLKNIMMSDSNLAGKQGADKYLTKAIVETVDEQFEIWKSTVTVPNLLWYPAFAFMPIPHAPPMPNIPSPLSALSFADHLMTNESMLVLKILSKLPHEMRNPSNEAIVEGSALKIADLFSAWLQTRHIIDALGMGNVPGFNPPFSLGGPVIGNVVERPGVIS